MISYSPNRKFNSLWQKYRPVVLRLMIDAGQAPQQYKFSDHEFIRLNPTQKRGYGFTMTLFKSQSVNNIRNSEVAGDLLTMLRQSKTAVELSEHDTYEFVLDSKYVLHVNKQPAQVATIEEEPIESTLVETENS